VFTGIVEEVGRVTAVADSSDGRRIKLAAKVVTGGLKLGDSIAVAGCCLTAVAFGSDWFEVEATHQTLRMTRLGALKTGSAVNLERALRLNDRLGGHLVTGHIDGLARVHSIKTEGFSRLITFEADAALAGLFVEKGSVAIDGISLTVAGLGPVSSNRFTFTVALIPHTMEVTTVGELTAGSEVNIEADLVAKYVARWLEPSIAGNVNKAGITAGFLAEHGYT
jgi:riboflavin synthase